MASLLKIPKSPFWYLSYKDGGGRWLKISTGLRHDDANDTAEAQIARLDAEKKEIAHGMVASIRPEDGRWDTWVEEFLDRHCANPVTRMRYAGHWKWLHLWLEHSHLYVPRQITYRLALEYVKWRTSYKKKSGRTVERNTALGDLKVLALVMREAVRLDFIVANPLASLGLKKTAAAKKTEYTSEDLDQLRAALAGEPEWMQLAFEIALHTGCRLRETVIPLSCVDLRQGGVGKITFPSPKGGEKRAFSIPMPPELRSMFERMKREGRKVTLTLPFQPSRRWQQFLKVHRLPEDWLFHSLRVTKINALRRAGVPRDAAKRLVNHASDLVHQVYQREEFEDLIQYAGAGRYRSADAATESSHPRPHDPEQRESRTV